MAPATKLQKHCIASTKHWSFKRSLAQVLNWPKKGRCCAVRKIPATLTSTRSGTRMIASCWHFRNRKTHGRRENELSQCGHYIVCQQIDRFFIIGAEFGEGDVIIAKPARFACELDDLIPDFFRCAGCVISLHHRFGHKL